MLGLFKRRKSTKSMSDDEQKALIRKFRNIAADFGQVLEENPAAAVIRDVKELPHPKDEIRKALSFIIMTGPEEHIIEAAHAALLCLADYQEGIGEPLHIFGEPVASLRQKKIEESSEQIAEAYPKFQKFSAIVEAERDLFDALAKKLKGMS